MSHVNYMQVVECCTSCDKVLGPAATERARYFVNVGDQTYPLHSNDLNAFKHEITICGACRKVWRYALLWNVLQNVWKTLMSPGIRDERFS